MLTATDNRKAGLNRSETLALRSCKLRHLILFLSRVSQIFLRPLHGFPQIGLVHDAVTVTDGPRFVSADCHGNALSNPAQTMFLTAVRLIEELINGVPLWNRLDKEFDGLDPHLAAHVLYQLSKAVAASHHAGVFHRDLKPSNIMVSRDPGIRFVKVTDFGIAKMAEEEIAEAFKDKESTTLTEQESKRVSPAQGRLTIEIVDEQNQAPAKSDSENLNASEAHESQLPDKIALSGHSSASSSDSSLEKGASSPISAPEPAESTPSGHSGSTEQRFASEESTSPTETPKDSDIPDATLGNDASKRE